MPDHDEPTKRPETSEPETVTELLDHWGEQGTRASFRPGPEPATIHCPVCDSDRPGREFDVIEERRLEGESDPDDMVLAVAARCPVCHISGSIVLGFGTEASDTDSDIVLELSQQADR